MKTYSSKLEKLQKSKESKDLNSILDIDQINKTVGRIKKGLQNKTKDELIYFTICLFSLLSQYLQIHKAVRLAQTLLPRRSAPRILVPPRATSNRHKNA